MGTRRHNNVHEYVGMLNPTTFLEATSNKYSRFANIGLNDFLEVLLE